MATPSHFQIINKNQFFKIIKIEFRHRVGNAFERSKMRGPQRDKEIMDCTCIYCGQGSEGHLFTSGSKHQDDKHKFVIASQDQ